jgi:hypothetical protein
MRILISVLSFVLTTLGLLSCGRQQPTVDIDPQLGHDCYASLLVSLPNGTQYEGIERATADRLTIRVMTGAEVTTVECVLNPDGRLQKLGE